MTLKSRFRDMTLRKKLFGFVGLAIVLVLTIVGTGMFYYSRIESANALKEDVRSVPFSVEAILKFFPVSTISQA